MVSISHPGAVAADFDRWATAAGLDSRWPPSHPARHPLRLAFDEALRLVPDSRAGCQAAELLAGLGLDSDAVIAGLLHETVDSHRLSLEQARERYGEAVAKLLQSASYLHQAGELGLSHERSSEQLENLRKMLLAMAQDIRVVLVILAVRLCLMRANANLNRPQAQRQRLAQETLNIFAPLANRLGIGQIKWELEDLALRDLKPDVYKAIAQALDERRADRERYINRVVAQLKAALGAAALDAEVRGRAKHIYSIWNKMQRKKLLFDQLFDVRAVRITVAEVADCYAALGVVHSLWKNIQQEFDDYIANPKANGYRSLHTAVVGPGGKTLEVQIRTREMHRHAEFGIAAHWRYKEGGRDQDRSLEKQILWFRQMLELRDAGETDDLLEQIEAESQGQLDRVYVRTPKGDIVDLMAGATPLDFAYSVHTEVGHRCRGARVNGRIVPLGYQLQNGDQVEILTVKGGSPSRDWLSPHLGYLRSPRARAKVRHWFRQQDRDKNLAAGRLSLEQEFRRLNVGLKQFDLDAVAGRFNFSKADELFIAIGSGDLTTASVTNAIQDLILPTPAEPPLRKSPRRPSGVDRGGGKIQVRGVGNLLTQIARCCQPVPFESIVGYVTHGRGVTIHRADCGNALSLRERHPERILEVNWGQENDRRYTTEVELEAFDRPGLLRDVSTVLANDAVNVLAVNTRTDAVANSAQMTLTLEINSLDQLSRVLNKIGRLSNVTRAYRKT